MKKGILVLLCMVSIQNVIGQGCSDAGFCSILGTMPLSTRPEKKVNMLRVSASMGRADQKVMAYNMALEYSRWVSNTITINTRVNYLAHSGGTVETGEIGDVYLTGDFKISPKLTAVTGFKIPLRNGDKVKHGVVLPMEYQPSLGTFDFLFALQTQCHNWSMALGYQQPLTQNKNQFFSNNFIGSEDFQTTNGFYRNPDIWARLAYHITMDKLSIIPSLLPIYHIGNDNYVDEFGMKQYIYGSKGLTFNTSVQLDYKICKSSVIGLNGALPLIIRDARPDGLTRKYLITLDLRHSF